jgi:hypothetical protein
MPNILVLDVRNAGLFMENSFKNSQSNSSSDVYPNNYLPDRKSVRHTHVANVLQVLCGLRPIPTIRKKEIPLQYSFDPEILECSKNGKIKIDTEILHTYEDKKKIQRIGYAEKLAETKMNSYTGVGVSGPYDKGAYISRSMHLHNGTCFNNSTLNTSYLSWDFVKYSMIYNNNKRCEEGMVWFQFENIIFELIGEDYEKFSPYAVLEKLNNLYHVEGKKELIDEFFNKYSSKIKDLYKSIILRGSAVIEEGKSKGESKSIVSGFGELDILFVKFVNHTLSTKPENGVMYLTGTIYIPISDRIKSLISEQGKGSATFLEGGLVTIRGCYSDYDVSWDEITVNATNLLKVEGY